jgi:hypothetical protein
MFENENDPVPLKPLLPRWLVVSVMIGGVAVFFLGLVTTTSVFTRGELGSLPSNEREILSRIEQIGIRVLSEPTSGFGAPPHIVPEVMWQYSLGEYAVTAVTILNAEMDALTPELQKLVRLQEIRVPYLTEGEVETIKREFPDVVVMRSYN